MDTSEQYIKMRQEAHEIQEIGKNNFAVGDWYSSGLAGTYLLIDAYNDNGGWSIWLPRQDQLQEMIIDNKYSFIRWIEKFYKFSEKNYPFDSSFSMNGHIFDTFEQLWLAFIMKENFNKQWNFEKEIWKSIN